MLLECFTFLQNVLTVLLLIHFTSKKMFTNYVIAIFYLNFYTFLLGTFIRKVHIVFSAATNQKWVFFKKRNFFKFVNNLKTMSVKFQGTKLIFLLQSCSGRIFESI